jgi:5-(carboxyamino)imidazole ribonucleotide synthase
MKSKRLGIIGGGQLARMLAEACHRLGVHSVLYCEKKTDPAYDVAHEVILGNLEDPKKTAEFLSKIEVLTFENEFINVTDLETSLSNLNPKPYVYPSLLAVSVSQNKLRQKELFLRLHIETAKHLTIQGRDDLFEAGERLGFPFVLKWSMYGYDGKGNKVIHTAEQFEQGMMFVTAGQKQNVKTYAEAFVQFQSEAAMVFTRTRAGALEHFPLVKTVQENSTCKTVEGPATRMGWPATLESQAIDIGRLIGESLQMVGTFAVEFFVVGKKLVVNEMAPRVHNSGHFSLNALEVDQFENHVRAVCGLGLIDPGTSGYFGMVNLLGPANLDMEVSLTTEQITDWMKGESKGLDKRLFPYWYGKTGLRPGRKLGHINVKADSLAELMDGILMAKEAEAKLWKRLGSKDNT